MVLQIAVADAVVFPFQNDFKLEVKFVVILIQVHHRQKSDRHPHNDWNNCSGAIPMKRRDNLVVALDQSEQTAAFLVTLILTIRQIVAPVFVFVS